MASRPRRAPSNGGSCWGGNFSVDVAAHTKGAFCKDDLAHIQKKKDEEKALKDLKVKASQKGSFGGAGLKKSGKK